MIKKFGGDEENRTPDPLLARQVLSQLSYTPSFPQGFSCPVVLWILLHALAYAYEALTLSG